MYIVLRASNKNIKFIEQSYLKVLPLIFIFFSTVIHAQNILSAWNLNTDSLPTTQMQHVISGSFSKGTYLTSLTFTSSGATGKPWPSGEIDSIAFFQIWIAPLEAYELKITAIRFGERRSLTGPLLYEVRVNKKPQIQGSQLLSTFEIPDNDSERTGDITNLNIHAKFGDTLFIRWYAAHAESSAGSWRINDKTLKLEGIVYPEFENDTSSILINLTQPNINSISSLINSPQKAIEIFHFAISDIGNSDNLPTLISKVVLKNNIPVSTTNGINLIENAWLEQNHTSLTHKSLEITENNLSFSYDSGIFSVANLSTDTISLHIYLKSENLNDGARIGLKIPADDHGFEFFPYGSGFSNHFPNTIISPEITIQVVATTLKLNIFDKQIPVNTRFIASLEACDIFNNRDKDFQGLFTLNWESKTGQVSSASGMVKNMNQGFCQWENLQFNQSIPFILKTTHSSFGNIKSDTIWSYTPLFKYDFENTTMANFQDTLHWTISDENAIHGNYSLKHNLIDTSGISIIKTALPQNILKTGICQWQFTLKNSDWDPSSSNRFRFWLVTNTENKNGLAIGVDYKDQDDASTLYHVENDQVISFIPSDHFWDINTSCAFSVRSYPNGLWQFYYDTTLTFNHLYLAGSMQAPIPANIVYSALEYQFSSSRAGKLWFDDFSLAQINTGPYVEKIEPYKDSILIWLSEQANPSQVINTTTLTITDLIGHNVPIQTKLYYPVQNLVVLHSANLPTGSYMLLVNNLTDTNGIFNDPQNIPFRFSMSPKKGNLIITELMADPSPSVGLPEHDFLEFYNADNNEINLEGLKLQIGTKKFVFPKYYLPSRQYLIICSEAAFSEYSIFGRTLSLLGTNDLPVNGTTITVKTKTGEIIEALQYTPSLFTPETSEGGHSLEKINPIYPCAGKTNWTVSENIAGGTPGRENSQKNENFPINQILSLQLIDTSNIKVKLSTSVDSGLFLQDSLFLIGGNPANCTYTNYSSPFFDELTLQFLYPFQKNCLYTIAASEKLSDCINQTFNLDEKTFAFAEKPNYQDIIINEIMFNPLSGNPDFVELYNKSEKYFEISSLQLKNQSGSKTYIIASNKLLFFPGEFIVISPSIEKLNIVYHCNYEALINNNLPSFPDDKGSVILVSTNNLLIDSVIYSDNMHYAGLASKEGVSLERINPNRPSLENSNWHSAAETVGYATPGFKNSQYREESNNNDFFSLDPEIFSPDNDGYNDLLNLVFKTETAGNLCNIYIFDAAGRLIKTIADHTLLGTENTLSWDGTNEARKLVKPGIYIVFSEIYNPYGDMKKYQKTCVVAYKK